MTTLWIVSVVATSLCVTLAASLVERIVQLSGRPRRWVWGSAMALSVGLAAFSLWHGTRSQPMIVNTAASHVASGLHAPEAILRDGVTQIMHVPWMQSIVLASVEMLATAWGIMSIIALTLMCGVYGWLGIQRRRWTTGVVESSPVLVTPNVGPAVVGVFKPVVVLPAWLLGAPAQAQRIIVQHEKEHVAAGDSRLLMFAALLIVVMPWNVMLWWQYRRLHATIESDCDARVLAHGHDVRQYTEILLQVAARIVPAPHMSLGFCLRHSHLRDRIRAMTVRRRPGRHVQQTAFATLAGVAIFGAANTSILGGKSLVIAATTPLGPAVFTINPTHILSNGVSFRLVGTAVGTAVFTLPSTMPMLAVMPSGERRPVRMVTVTGMEGDGGSVKLTAAPALADSLSSAAESKFVSRGAIQLHLEKVTVDTFDTQPVASFEGNIPAK